MKETLYRLCPRCFRAVPVHSGEHFCANDGQKLLKRCPKCQTPIKSPYFRFCVRCGLEFSRLKTQNLQVGFKVAEG